MWLSLDYKRLTPYYLFKDILNTLFKKEILKYFLSIIYIENNL